MDPEERFGNVGLSIEQFSSLFLSFRFRLSIPLSLALQVSRPERESSMNLPRSFLSS